MTTRATHSYAQIAANLRAEIREDWCAKIEAADDLLKALDEMLATHELREHKGESITPLQRQAMDAARAALAKATC